MKLDQETLNIITEIAELVSSSNWIRGFDREDIKQEAIIIGMQGIEKYNKKTPLKQFLYTHIKHRLCSLRRKHYTRNICSCGKCVRCKNKADKQRINHAASLEDINENLFAYSVSSEFDTKELFEIIDLHLPAKYRDDYLKLINQVSIPSYKKKEVIKIVKEIIRDKYDKDYYDNQDRS